MGARMIVSAAVAAQPESHWNARAPLAAVAAFVHPADPTMTRVLSRVVPKALLLAAVLPFTGCATIIGTAVSPITGGVDLCRTTLRPWEWYWSPFVFLGGAIAGPFVAFYNGVNYDPTVFRNMGAYWHGFEEVFRPFHMISKG